MKTLRWMPIPYCARTWRQKHPIRFVAIPGLRTGRYRKEASSFFPLLFDWRTIVHSHPKKSGLYTLSAQDAERVQTEIVDIRRRNLEPASESLLLGSLYVQEALYARAIAAYVELLNQQPSPGIMIETGDLYLKTKLPYRALLIYSEALDILALDEHEDPILEADTIYGMGYAHFFTGEYEKAVEAFATSVHLYDQADATMKKAQAEASLSQVKEQLAGD